MKLRGYITHKAAELFSDCADYFGICPCNKRVAVSDGVGQSIMPAEWARLLVDSYLNNEWNPHESTKLLQDRWLQLAWDYFKEQKEQGKNPWLLENCLLNKDGAAATFCGVCFTDTTTWEASILGDSTLVEIDGSNHIISINSSKEGSFDFRPDYFESFGDDKGSIRYLKGTLEGDCKLLLVSDPFSELFQKIRGTEDEVAIITSILNIKEIDGFCSLVDNLRNDSGLHNDDSTLVIIEPDESDSFDIVYQKTLPSLLEEEAKRLEAERIRIEQLKKKDDEMWDVAIQDDSEEAYKRYLDDCPIGTHKAQAHKRLESIAKEKAEKDTWENALAVNTVEGFTRYIELFPHGLHLSEAKEIILKLKTAVSHGKKPDSEKEPGGESTSEDSFCQGTEKTTDEDSPSKNNALDSGSTVSATEEKTEEDNTTKESKAVDVKSQNCPEFQGACPAECLPPKSGEEGSSVTATKTGKQTGGNNKEEVEVEVEGEEEEGESPKLSLALPNGVDPSDGIDRVEFERLQETATLLFEKYHLRFEKEFSRQKWNYDRYARINQCFRDFWCELEGIIYKNKKSE